MNRPFVYTNMAMTVDGKITSSRREYPRFTSEQDRLNMDRLRAEADAILVGAETLRSDNPSLRIRCEPMRAYRQSLGKPPGLLRVLVTASGRVDTGCRFFTEDDGGGRIVATVAGQDDATLKSLAARAEIWCFDANQVGMAELLERLRNRGVERLLVEGGGELNWSLVRDGLVDELHVTIAPALLGGREAPTPLGGDGLAMKQRMQLKLAEVRREGDELFCRYTAVR